MTPLDKPITEHKTMTLWIPAGAKIYDVIATLQKEYNEFANWVVPYDVELCFANETKEELRKRLPEIKL